MSHKTVAISSSLKVFFRSLGKLKVFKIVDLELDDLPHNIRDTAGTTILHHNPEVCVFEVGSIVFYNIWRVTLLHDAYFLNYVLKVSVHRHLEKGYLLVFGMVIEKKIHLLNG